MATTVLVTEAARASEDFPATEGSSVMLVMVESAVDMDAEAAVKAVQAQGVDHFHIMIANAGVSNVFACVKDIDLKDLREMFEVNTGGTVSLFTATRLMLKKDGRPQGARGRPGSSDTDMGNAGAKFFGIEQAVVPVKVGVNGIMKHIAEVTREKTLGRLLSYN
ncbi:hypothetical protein DL771_005475 [Monosporascus sp. 5C6A]|nr:hypothetical protein DL771_005475 [Monosporascus sp. 5C6A]